MPAVTFDFQNPSSIPAYSITLFIGIFGLILIFLEDPVGDCTGVLESLDYRTMEKVQKHCNSNEWIFKI
jgi:hypothetical protein